MTSKKFDFVLFENAYHIENHYKDCSLLGFVLHEIGYKVAFANVFKEDKFCVIDGVQNILLGLNPFSLIKNSILFKKKNNSFSFYFARFIYELYTAFAIIKLNKKAANIYLGSLTSYTAVLWTYFLHKDTNYFLWGLRAHVLLDDCKGNDLISRSLRLLKKNIIENTNVKLIVSNEIIKKEFSTLVGIDSNRIIVRPERLYKGNNGSLHSNSFEHESKVRFLTIGTLRRSKHVENVLQAFKRLDMDGICYTIAGRCKNDPVYDKLISDEMVGMKNVKRINRFLSDDEFADLLNETDYVILCDEPESTCGSNGTLLEALFAGKPVIAPNFEPFTNELQSYNIGLLYNFGDVIDLENCLREGVFRIINRYEYNIEDYCKKYEICVVKQLLKSQLLMMLDNK